jgi:D-alanine-D-alanine ligase
VNNKIKVGVIFGGRSGEHEVSLVSAGSIIEALDKEKYDIIPIGISKEGKWLSSPDTLKLLKNKNSSLNLLQEKYLLPDPAKKGLVALDKNNEISVTNLDVIFPVIHGTYGEDGTLQGLLELANIAYVGSGVLASALGMDKVIQKQLFFHAGLPVTDYIFFTKEVFKKDINFWFNEIETKTGYPAFVKPANTGSSVGINKAHGREVLLDYIDEAFCYDRKVLIEKSVENAREIECSVIGGDFPEVSILGEIVSSNEFYDYNAKYVDGKSEAIIPANLTADIVKKIQEFSKRAFIALDCYGMARVDFFVTKNSNRIYLNEINTIPGFTSISMFVKLWEATELS